MDCLPNTRLLFDVIRNCWRSAVRDRHFCGVSNQFQSNTEVEERGAFSFTFKYKHLEFSVIGPFSKSVPEFKREVEKEFEARGGRSVRSARKSLRYELDKYLIEVDRVSSALGLKAPRARWSTANHLSWLTQYQLVPCKTYRQVAREIHKHEATVREGVQRTASLISLTLRSTEADKRSGRPKGARDKKPRHRVESGRQKLRGN